MRFNSYSAFSILAFCLFTFSSFGQLNMTLQDSIDYPVGVNDVCGWVANDGTEYALVGLNTGVSIVDVTQDSIVQVQFVAGVDNLWRDINTYSHYAYVSSEARVGLLIIDLQYLPDSVKTYIWKDSLPTGNGPKIFEKAHSLWTDDDGFLFLNGSNLNNGGVIICDIKTDPKDPIFLGYGPNTYTHDSYSRDSILYSAEIYAGTASIYDIHNPATPVLLGSVKTPFEFTHNIWLSDDSKTMFTTDERSNSYVTAYDITNPANIVELDRYRQAKTDGLGNIVHNVYVWNDWAIVAYYANGTTIVDVAHSDNMVEVGDFDSFLGQDGGFPGVWGSYPFLPSGKILSSDRNNGLFVFIPNYVRAAYLEGTVVDSLTHVPLNNAVVKIISDEVIYPSSTKPDGTFKMGKAIPGEYEVLVTKEGYHSKTLSFEFKNDSLLNPVIELNPIPSYQVGGKVVYADQTGVANARVAVFGNNLEFRTIADVNGNFLFPAIYEGTYEIQAGIWGYIYESQIDIGQPVNTNLEVTKGYKDDFDLDLGWTVAGNVSNGGWIREEPKEQLLYDQFLCGSEGDSQNDSGPFAYTTGTSNSGNVLDSEVSGGTTWLVSPPMDLTNLIDPKIHFDFWLCEFPPNQYDGVYLWLTNGIDTFFLDELRNDTIIGSWQTKEYDNLTLQAPLDQIRLMVSARDTTTGTNFFVVKMHFDDFELLSTPSSIDDIIVGSSFLLYPNPLTGSKLYLKPIENFSGKTIFIRIVDAQGKLVHTAQFAADEWQKGIDVRLAGGIYAIQWSTEKNEGGVEKLAVIRD